MKLISKAVFFVLVVAVMLVPARAERSIQFAAQVQSGDAIIVATTTEKELDTVTALLSETAHANFVRALAASGFSGEVGETTSLFLGDQAVQEIHLIGISIDDMRQRDWEDFGGRAGALAKSSKASRISVMAPGAGVGSIVAAAGGAMLGAHSFDKYKSEPEESVAGDLVFVLSEPGPARARFDVERRHLAEAVLWTRDMQSEPANELYPEEFVRRARAAFSGVGNVTIRVLNERQLARLGMNAHLGVGKGSVRPPRLLVVEYRGGEGDPLIFAGKGITFDTGGISLKSNSGMWMMKSDMTGAAAVTAAVMSLAKSKAPVNVVAVAALAENMPDGNAQRPGDVIRSMSGTTIEIMSTDAEGRLVLADAVWWAQEQYNPSLLVDVATLTGSVGRALGDEYGGLFSRDDDIAAQLIAAGDEAGEDLWRLPLHPNHNKQIKSVIADVKNGDTGAPGASTGAAFIGTFVKDETPWAHLDIAGVDWQSEATATVPVGATGFSVRLLDRLARDWSATNMDN